MRKSAINYWLFVALALLALLLAVSAFLLWIVFPRGYFPNRALWVDIHKWGGLTLATCVLLHVALHWRWVWQMTRQYNRRALRRFRSRKKAEVTQITDTVATSQAKRD